MIYLDNAATSWPKPPCVLEAVRNWFERLGVDASRGTSVRHQEVGRILADLRRLLAEEHGTEASRVILCSGATEAANLFLKGICRPGMRVWTTALEHNAVLRPLVGLRERRDLRLRVLEPGPSGVVEASDLTRALEAGPPPDLLVCNHASNVSGAVQDLAALGRLAKEAGALVLADVAQTSGRLDLQGLPVDAMIVPGHKAWWGPPGTGALCLSPEAPVPLPLHEGGTGSTRALDRMPETLPEALEAGTPNTPGFCGWLASILHVRREGRGTLLARELEARNRLWELLAPGEEEGLWRRTPPAPGRPLVPVLSLVLVDLDPVEVGMGLEQEGIQVRTGFHCAPYIHRHLGSLEAGTLRLSPGTDCGSEAMEEVARTLETLCRTLRD